MSTPKYGYHTPVSSPLESRLQKAHSEKWSQDLELHRTQVARHWGRGFWSPFDLVPTAIAATLGVQISPGGAYVGPDDDYTHHYFPNIQTIQNGVGGHTVVASTTNYFWLKADGTWTVNTTGVNPVPNSAILAFTGAAGATDFITGGSLNSNPTGRVNIPFYKGRRQERIVLVSANYAVGDFDDIIEVTANSPTITLPDPTTRRGWFYTVKNSGVGVVTIATAAATIDGAATKSLASQWSSMDFYSNGTAWRVR